MDQPTNSTGTTNVEPAIVIESTIMTPLSSIGPPPGAASVSPNLLLGGILASTTVALTLGLTAPFVFTRGSPLPYMATPKNKVIRALKYLKEHTIINTHHPHLTPNDCCKKNKNRPLFVDLGSGDGETLYQASRLGYRAIGYELNFTLFLLSSLRRLTWPNDLRTRTTIQYGNFFHTTTPPEATVVMIFGVTPLMPKLSVKLQRELEVGAHIMSYRFELPTSIRDDCDDDELVYASLVYDREEMKIYQIQKRNAT